MEQGCWIYHFMVVLAHVPFWLGPSRNVCQFVTGSLRARSKILHPTSQNSSGSTAQPTCPHLLQVWRSWLVRSRFKRWVHKKRVHKGLLALQAWSLVIARFWTRVVHRRQRAQMEALEGAGRNQLWEGFLTGMFAFFFPEPAWPSGSVVPDAGSAAQWWHALSATLDPRQGGRDSGLCTSEGELVAQSGAVVNWSSPGIGRVRGWTNGGYCQTGSYRACGAGQSGGQQLSNPPTH